MRRLRRGEIGRIGAGVPSGKFGNDGAAFGNCQRQFTVAGRIDAVGAGTDHRDGVAPSASQRTAMRRRASMPRARPLTMHQPWPARVRGELFGVAQTLWRGIAAADDANRRALQQRRIAAHVDDARWVGDFQQGLAG
jgi:hypothetical protein